MSTRTHQDHNPGEVPLRLPAEYGDENIHYGSMLRVLDNEDAEHWLSLAQFYTFHRWGNKGLLQVVEHPGVNFDPNRFVLV